MHWWKCLKCNMRKDGINDMDTAMDTLTTHSRNSPRKDRHRHFQYGYADVFQHKVSVIVRGDR